MNRLGARHAGAWWQGDSSPAVFFFFFFFTLIEIFRLAIHEWKNLDFPSRTPVSSVEQSIGLKTFIRKTVILLKIGGVRMVAVFFPLWFEATRNCSLIIHFTFLFRSRSPLRRRSDSRECKTFSRNGNKCKKIYEEILMCK